MTRAHVADGKLAIEALNEGQECSSPFRETASLFDVGEDSTIAVRALVSEFESVSKTLDNDEPNDLPLAVRY